MMHFVWLWLGLVMARSKMSFSSGWRFPFLLSARWIVGVLLLWRVATC
jgi:hypothetical protein